MKIIRLEIELVVYGEEKGQFRGRIISQQGECNVESPLTNGECQSILNEVDDKMVSDKLEEKVIQSPLN
tara:strand:+ start:617 stop:823 length:207 start_codon:yes stop_codon:yes gene_type:complete